MGGGGGVETTIECGEPPVVEGPFSKRALLEASALCAEWHYCEFDNAATLLQRRIDEWVQDPSEATQAAARDAWRRSMDTWSLLELFQYGPAGSSSLDPYHGANYRDRIYAWPSQARCRVEDQVASQRFATAGMADVLTSGRGLFALEYLLFYPGSDHACLSTSSTAKTWATLSEAELGTRKRDYAGAVSQDIVELIRELRNLWDPAGDNFRQKLIDAVGYEKPAVGKDQEALNIVAWSFVYVERQVKDWKVGYPAELNPTAPVNGFESPYARRAVQALRANLRAFRSLFEGCGKDGAGIGFDDWLIEAGHGDLAEDMIAAWREAQAAADAFPPFEEASVQQFLDLHASIKTLTDLIKNDFLAGTGSPLNLSMPQGFEGDND